MVEKEQEGASYTPCVPNDGGKANEGCGGEGKLGALGDDGGYGPSRDGCWPLQEALLMVAVVMDGSTIEAIG
jgi:hypothetical protein